MTRLIDSPRPDGAATRTSPRQARAAAMAAGHLTWLAMLVLLVGLALWQSPARAQSTGDADPPGRAGRLAEVQGQVWLYDTEEGEWIEAVRNRPLTTGDRLSTERGARAEVRVGSTAIRIDESTELEVTRLDDTHLSLTLHRGGAAARLRSRETAREFELLTAEGRFHTDRAGTYRFARDDDTTEATTVSGLLQVQAADAGITVKPGQRYDVWQDNGTQYELTEPRIDGFSAWITGADDRDERSVSARYASPEMTGIEELDHHGRWEQDAEQGPLWIPSAVPVGWVPYRAGHWAWVSPWGWTWIDDAPWGFAPFHYGRWVHRGSGWGWSPGRYTPRPIYAPALVAWIGGAGGGVSIGVGRQTPPRVGWFPLGPREVYVPAYRFSPHYMRAVNGNHVAPGFNFNPYVRDPRRAVLDAHYRHRHYAPAVTIVPSQIVERRRPVGPAIIAVGGRPVPGFDRMRPRPDAPVRPFGRDAAPERRSVRDVIPSAPGGLGQRFGAERPPGAPRAERGGADRRGEPRAVMPRPDSRPDIRPDVRPDVRAEDRMPPGRDGRFDGRGDGRPDLRGDGRPEGRGTYRSNEGRPGIGIGHGNNDGGTRPDRGVMDGERIRPPVAPPLPTVRPPVSVDTNPNRQDGWRRELSRPPQALPPQAPAPDARPPQFRSRRDDGAPPQRTSEGPPGQAPQYRIAPRPTPAPQPAPGGFGGQEQRQRAFQPPPAAPQAAPQPMRAPPAAMPMQQQPLPRGPGMRGGDDGPRHRKFD